MLADVVRRAGAKTLKLVSFAVASSHTGPTPLPAGVQKGDVILFVTALSTVRSPVFGAAYTAIPGYSSGYNTWYSRLATGADGTQVTTGAGGAWVFRPAADPADLTGVPPTNVNTGESTITQNATLTATKPSVAIGFGMIAANSGTITASPSQQVEAGSVPRDASGFGEQRFVQEQLSGGSVVRSWQFVNSGGITASSISYLVIPGAKL